MKMGLLWYLQGLDTLSTNPATRNMNLCIDIGNTRIKWGIFEEDSLVHKDSFQRNYTSKLEEVFKKYQIKRSISSSTRKKASSMEKLVADYCEHTILDYKTPLPIKNMYKTPETLGRDRIAAVVAAHAKYSQKGNLVIDLGTCITYDFISLNGDYLGGNIAPGVHMRLNAMHHFTDGLPLIDMKLPNKILGDSTETAMQNGAVRGTIMEINSFLNTMSDFYGELNVILTGGDAIFFGELLNTEIFVAPSLVLTGLNEILKYNA